MEENPRKKNENSTPADNKEVDVKYHVNQSTEKKAGGNIGVIAIIIIIAIIVLGLLFFGPWAV